MKYWILAFACSLAPALPSHAAVTRVNWGETADHQRVDLYTLSNAHGLSARIATIGGVIVELRVPDRQGRSADIVRGFDTLDDYANPAKDPHFYGSLVGRYANIIDGARFTLDGRVHELIANSGRNTLHGGPVGFNRRVWSAVARDGSSPRLTLRYTSPDGENNFPGTLQVTVIYTLTADDTLRIDYRASTDKPTILNLTNHSYFNLKGHAAGDVLDHELQIMADEVSQRDGRIEPVRGTALDFTRPSRIGAHIDDGDPRLGAARGYNQNYIIRGRPGTLRTAARVVEPESGRVMEVLTTQPGMMLYTANLATPVVGKGGAQYLAHGAVCLETQHYPNSANIKAFPSTELRPRQQFHEVTVFRFTTQ
jgi:aldose 1-epimerase